MSIRIRLNRQLLLLVILFLIALTPFYIYRHPNSLQVFTKPEVADISIKLGTILEYIESTHRAARSRYDPKPDTEKYGLQLGDTSPSGYEHDTLTAYNEFFDPQNVQLRDETMAYLDPLPNSTGAIPKNIYTTSTVSPWEFPEQFKMWAKTNPTWKVRNVNEDDIDVWLDRTFTTQGGGELEIVRLMKALKGKWGIIRADLFRYLILYTHGGLYTDMDTACNLPIEQWAPHPHQYLLHPLHEALPHLLSLSNSQHSRGVTLNPVEDDPPSLVVSIEWDAPRWGADFRNSNYARGLQIVQWTLMSKKGHPVLLDAMNKALKKAQRVLDHEEDQAWEKLEGDAWNFDLAVLDWSGPGAFTDCVLRYLLARYGVHPSDVSGITSPTRFGDVLIMPEHAFHADVSEYYLHDGRVVWHGFFGQWRGERQQKKQEMNEAQLAQ